MAYLLEFPRSTLPDNVRAPPYVVFGIKGTRAVGLPLCIPLNMVLHFVPKLAQWVLVVPENLPPTVAQSVLRTPHVGIDIHHDIGPASLQRIVFKMMQSTGFAMPKNVFQHAPSLITAVSICKTWMLLELPPSGLDNMLIHMQARIMTGPPVRFNEIRGLWAHFPPDHMILRLAASNFVQAHIDWYYSRDEFSSIRHWYLSSKERYKVFKWAEDRFPEFGTRSINFPMRGHVNSEATESRRKAREQQGEARKDDLETRKTNALRKASMDGLRNVRSVEDLKEMSHGAITNRKTTKLRVKSKLEEMGGADTIEMGVMTSLLDDALRKVQEERDGEEQVEEEKARTFEYKAGNERESELWIELSYKKEKHRVLQNKADNETRHESESKVIEKMEELECL